MKAKTETENKENKVIRYREGAPMQVRCDQKHGNFNVAGRRTIGSELQISPIAWCFFEDAIFAMKKKNWVEIYFIHENSIAAVLFHSHSLANLEKLLGELFYEGIDSMLQIKLNVTFSQHKNDKVDGKPIYFLAEFDFELCSEDEVKAKQEIAANFKLYRKETITAERLVRETFNYFVTPALAIDSSEEAVEV